MTQEETKRNRKYNEKVTLESIGIELRPTMCRLEFRTKEYGIITHKLKKYVEKKTTNNLGIEVRMRTEETITEENLNNSLPLIVMEMAKLLKDKKPLHLNICYSEMTVKKEEEEITYRFFYDGDLITLYCKEIHKDNKENIEKQIDNEQKAKEKYKVNF